MDHEPVHGKRSGEKLQAHLGFKAASLLKTLTARATALVKERKSLLAQKADFDAKYCAVDVKNAAVFTSNPYADKLAINDMALAEMRSIARTSFGQKALRVMLLENWSIPVSALGVMNTGTLVDPSGFAEFAASAALFDEYRVVGGELKFNLPCFSINNATNVETQAVLVYDPDGTGAALTSAGVAASYQQHVVVPKTFITAGSLAILRTTQKQFKYRVPPGVLTTVGALVSTATGSSWQPTVPNTGTFLTYGTLRGWGNNLSPISLTGFSGLHYYHVEFRCRE
jgi:hypothetical protein